jgi:hypothetical protein
MRYLSLRPLFLPELLRGSSAGPSRSDLPTNRLLWLSASERALSLRGSDCRNLRSVRRLTPAIYGQASRVRLQDGENLNGCRDRWPRRDDLADVELSTESLCVYLCVTRPKYLWLTARLTCSNPASRRGCIPTITASTAGSASNSSSPAMALLAGNVFVRLTRRPHKPGWPPPPFSGPAKADDAPIEFCHAALT